MKPPTYKTSLNTSGWLRGTKQYTSVHKQYKNGLPATQL